MLKKILLSIVVLIGVLILSAIITILVFKTGLDKARSSEETVFKNEKSNGREALVIYQNCRSQFPKEIAESIATGLNNKGLNVTVNTAGNFLPSNLSKYDVVVLGGAVIAGNLGNPLKEYARNIENFGSSKIVLYSTGGQVDNTIELDNLENLLSKKSNQKIKFAYSDKENSKIKAIALGEDLGKN